MKKNKFGRSNKIMPDISDGKAILVIPMIRVLECIDAIRRHVPRESKQHDMPANDAKKKIAQTTMTFVDFFTLQEKANHAIVLRTHGHADEYFKSMKSSKNTPFKQSALAGDTSTAEWGL